MATASEGMSEDLCSICLHVFTDPVSLSCRHSFCRRCLEQLWSKAVIWKCPSCKKQFNTKPELTMNRAVKFRFNQHHTAQKSRLAYLTMPRLKTHQLMEPQGNLQKRMCPEHKKPLELFCITDQLCVCMLCTYSQHVAHEVVPLKEASEQQKQQLKKTKAIIIRMINMRTVMIKELHVTIDRSNANAVKQIAKGIEVLNDLVKSPSLIQNIDSLKAVTENKGNHYIHELEQEISVLETKKTEVEKVLKSEDKVHLLQNMQMISIPTTKDWTNVVMSPPTYQGIVARALFQLEDELSKKTKEMFEAELKRAKSFEKNVKLDCDSADPRLNVSADCKSVVHSPEIRLTRDTDKRFDGLFVLGKQSFTESFYFEVVVSKKPVWTVGVAREGVQKKGIILIPKNGFWTISLREKTYYASGDTEVSLSIKCKPTTVGVFVNKEEGLISFYDVNATALIYSFTIDYFVTNLQPICNPGSRSLKNMAPLKVGLPSPPVPKVKLHKEKPKVFHTLPHRQRQAILSTTNSQVMLPI